MAPYSAQGQVSLMIVLNILVLLAEIYIFCRKIIGLLLAVGHAFCWCNKKTTRHCQNFEHSGFISWVEAIVLVHWPLSSSNRFVSSTLCVGIRVKHIYMFKFTLLCDAVHSRRITPTFQRKLLPPQWRFIWKLVYFTRSYGIISQSPSPRTSNLTLLDVHF
jgi:hypothetical protein